MIIGAAWDTIRREQMIEKLSAITNDQNRALDEREAAHRRALELVRVLLTSPEIVAAIEQIVSGAVYDESSDAYRVWSSPTDAEMKRVSALAWTYAKADEVVLHWGDVKTLRRWDGKALLPFPSPGTTR